MQPRGDGHFLQPQEQAPQYAGGVPVQPPVPSAPQPPVQSDYLSWQASEYVHHEKDKLWFLILFGLTAALLAVALLVIQSITFAVLIVVMAITMAVFAVRPPRINTYSITSSGIQINDKHFLYHDFRYFDVVQDGPLYTAVLIPNKRFMPAVTVYFPSENGEEIVDAIGAHLPMEQVELDLLDQVVRRLRF